MNQAISSELRISAFLLAGGWVTFWAGAVNPAAARFFLPMPVRQQLDAIAAHREAWLAIAACFAVGVLLTLAGFVVLRVALRQAGDDVWSALGQAAFAFGAVLWLVSIAFRATVTVAAAKETAATGTIPAWFEPMRSWAGVLFAVYMVLAYLAIAAFGRALLATSLAPRWLGRTHVVFGLVGAAGFLARVPAFIPPLMVHLVPGILGLNLLFRRAGAR
jgi:hypothetical protein